MLGEEEIGTQILFGDKTIFTLVLDIDKFCLSLPFFLDHSCQSLSTLLVFLKNILLVDLFPIFCFMFIF